ncbi:flavodoxin [Bacteroides sp. GD17]|uniref:flavodoxin n=1 Tax=Bacteroides sp. GD17 TaxID=3139826 RepID=UPI0025DE7690|nr:flavodoxin [uncultured Bacteroides sp.]
MKRLIMILMCALPLLSLGAQEKKVLVAYFSCTGNTESVAKAIATEVKGDLYRIAPEKAYTNADLDWRNKQSRSSVEMGDEASRPPLADKKAAVEKYDVIFIGFPIWWNTYPRIVNTFLESYNFKGKIVIPFATSGSSSIANSEKMLREHYGNGVTLKPGRLCNDGADASKKWARQTLSD